MSDPILILDKLSVSFPEGKERRTVVSEISISVNRGEILGVVGESGSGKSVTFMSIMGLVPKAVVEATRAVVHFDDLEYDLLSLTEEGQRALLRDKISYVFQEPMTALNPLMKCGKQVKEALPPDASKQDVLKLFAEVELPDPDRVYDSYPHEISGGQRQRVMIAMALGSDPELLIADEPTTALDPLVQNAVVDLLVRACRERNMAMVFVSHDLDLVARTVDRIAVMDKGLLVEDGPSAQIYNDPKEKYTRHLLASRPRYADRPTDNRVLGEVILKGSSISKTYEGMNKDQSFKALEDVSFQLHEGESLGLIGESGSGKSTLGKIAVRLISGDTGSIDLLNADPRKVQMVFQDPFSSLDPKQRIGDAIMEPMRYHKIVSSKKEAESEAKELLRKVGLNDEHFRRYPHEFSGGQRQRICIARALSVRPKVLVCDESVSALDVSVQAVILDLLYRLQKDTGVSYLFISHDLNVVSYLCNRIIVLKDGKVEEEGRTAQLLTSPQSEYTRSLLGTVIR